MASLLLANEIDLGGPLDLIEQIVTAHDWPYDRLNEDELTVFVAGQWSEYSLHFAWNRDAAHDFGGLQFVCAFDGRIPVGHHAGLYKLLALINSQMWLGHFDIAEEECQVNVWCLNHLFSPNIRKKAMSGCVLALDNQCCNIFMISECSCQVEVVGHFKIWSRCSSGD